MPNRYPPEDPREWLNRARSNLALAKAKRKGVYLEDLCFVHDLARLLTLLEKSGQKIPQSIRQAEGLSRYAVFTRYPGMGPQIKQNEYKEAVKIAGQVVRWAERLIAKKP